MEKMQDVVMRIWQEADPENIPNILASVFNQLDDLDLRQEASSEAFLNYLTYIVSLRIGDNQDSEKRRDVDWEQEQGMAANLLREHMPYIYMSWIFSSLSDEELFQGGHETRRVFIIGQAGVEVWMDGEYIGGIDSNGKPLFLSEDEYLNEVSYDRNQSVFIVRNGMETMVCLPENVEFQLKIRTDSMEELVYYDVIGSAEVTRGDISEMHVTLVTEGKYLLNFPAGKNFSKLEVLEGKILRDGTVGLENSPTTVMSIESSVNPRFTLAEVLFLIMALVLYILVLLAVCLVICIVHRARKKKHGPYTPWTVIVPHLLLIIPFTALTQYATAYFFMFPIARVAFSAATMLVIFLLALRGLIRNRNLPNLFITAGILGLGFLNSFVYQRSSLVSSRPLQFAVYCVLIAAVTVVAVLTFWTGRKKHAE